MVTCFEDIVFFFIELIRFVPNYFWIFLMSDNVVTCKSIFVISHVMTFTRPGTWALSCCVNFEL